jgi:hypothetical protein
MDKRSSRICEPVKLPKHLQVGSLDFCRLVLALERFTAALPVLDDSEASADRF